MREPVEALFSPQWRAAYRVLRATVAPALNRAYTVHAEGLEHLPERGPAILAANHLSFLDSFFVPLVVRRRVIYLAKAEYWDSWRTRWLVEAAGHVPVRRDSAVDADEALDRACRFLASGGLVGIYPEGTRSPDGRLYKSRTGVVRLAARSGCPIVPVGIAGTDRILPKGRRRPRIHGDVTIRLGPALRVPREADGRPRLRRAVADELTARIQHLSGQSRAEAFADRTKGDTARPPKAREPVRELVGV